MADSFEKNYNRTNAVLSVVIGVLLMTVGGLWLHENKNWAFKSPVSWVTDQALKNQANKAGMPNFEATQIKGLEFDSTNVMKGLQFSREFKGDMDKRFGNFQPSTIRMPPYQPPAHKPGSGHW